MTTSKTGLLVILPVTAFAVFFGSAHAECPKGHPPRGILRVDHGAKFPVYRNGIPLHLGSGEEFCEGDYIAPSAASGALVDAKHNAIPILADHEFPPDEPSPGGVAGHAELERYGDGNKLHAQMVILPKCDRPVGTVAVVEPGRKWWLAYGLSSPESLIKLYSERSNCLRVVDRDPSLAAGSFGSNGDLQRGSNVGAGQIKAADYTIVPDIADANQNGGGGAFARFSPGSAGALLGGMRTKSSTAHVLLNLVNARTTEQEYTAEGTAQKATIDFGGTDAGRIIDGVGGGYSNTDVGQIISEAYLNAFVDLVSHIQGMQPGSAQAAAPIQSYTVQKPVVMRDAASSNAKAVRKFNIGDSVFPTGKKNGVWWEVDDENGNRGWVTSGVIEPK